MKKLINPLILGVVLAVEPEITIKKPGLVTITDIGTVISSGIAIAIIVAVLLCFVYLIWGGIQWLTSGGEKTSYQAARDRITAALIGLMIVVVSWALVRLLEGLLGIEVLKKLTLPKLYEQPQ